jgi:allantoinase
LWKALERALIDMVTTDHSPCPPAMKRREEGRWDQAWGGIASLGLALPVMWTAMNGAGMKEGTDRRVDGRSACAAGGP